MTEIKVNKISYKVLSDMLDFFKFKARELRTEIDYNNARQEDYRLFVDALEKEIALRESRKRKKCV